MHCGSLNASFKRTRSSQLLALCIKEKSSCSESMKLEPDRGEREPNKTNVKRSPFLPMTVSLLRYDAILSCNGVSRSRWPTWKNTSSMHTKPQRFWNTEINTYVRSVARSTRNSMRWLAEIRLNRIWLETSNRGQAFPLRQRSSLFL